MVVAVVGSGGEWWGVKCIVVVVGIQVATYKQTHLLALCVKFKETLARLGSDSAGPSDNPSDFDYVDSGAEDDDDDDDSDGGGRGPAKPFNLLSHLKQTPAPSRQHVLAIIARTRTEIPSKDTAEVKALESEPAYALAVVLHSAIEHLLADVEAAVGASLQ